MKEKAIEAAKIAGMALGLGLYFWAVLCMSIILWG